MSATSVGNRRLQRVQDAAGCAQLIADLMALLFASPLQPSQHPSAARVRAAVCQMVQSDPDCFDRLPQEMGDHPEAAAARARWCRRTVLAAYGLEHLAGSGAQTLPAGVVGDGRC